MAEKADGFEQDGKDDSEGDDDGDNGACAHEFGDGFFQIGAGKFGRLCGQPAFLDDGGAGGQEGGEGEDDQQEGVLRFRQSILRDAGDQGEDDHLGENSGEDGGGRGKDGDAGGV